jgi:hypothetical protein
MSKITITKKDGSQGVLTREADGRWTPAVGGKSAGNFYYEDAQVARIVERARAAGDNVVCE